MFYDPKTRTFISNWMSKPGFCIRRRRGTHIIPTLVWANKVVNALRVRTNAFIAGLVQNRRTPWSKPKHGYWQLLSYLQLYNIGKQLNKLTQCWSIVQCHRCLMGKWFIELSLTSKNKHILKYDDFTTRADAGKGGC
jgi:hypothetical protein